MVLTAGPNELCTPFTVDTLLPFPLIPWTKEAQIDDAKDDDSGDNNIAVAATLTQIVKALKIHKPNLYYSNQNKLKG